MCAFLLLLAVALLTLGCRVRTFTYYAFTRPGATEADCYSALKACTDGRDAAQTRLSASLAAASRKNLGVPAALTPDALPTVDLCMRVAGWQLNEIRVRHRPPLGSMVLGQPEPRVTVIWVR